MEYRLSASSAAAAALLLQNATRQHPPQSSFQAHLYQSYKHTPQTVGAYLHSLGYLSTDMIAAIVRRQREQRHHYGSTLFGDLAIRSKLVHPHVVTAVLVTQMIDRLLLNAGIPPKLLGEQLVVSGRVSLMQIAAAIEYQLRMRQQGRTIQLGDILILHNALDRQDLETVVQQQSVQRPPLLVLEVGV